METIEHKGLTFAVAIEHDDSMGPPWKEHDGHGIVTEWVNRDKAPGERLLVSDHHSRRFYDVQETMKLAKRDGWGLNEEALAALEKRLGRKPKRGDIVAEAVARDYDHLRRWCNDQWSWCGVVVTLLDVDGERTNEGASLWGIESDCYSYHEEVARELAEEVAARIGRRKKIFQTWRVRR